MTCAPLRQPFAGQSRNIETGKLATRKQDFNAHVSGADFTHCADQIKMNPPLSGALAGNDVQQTLELISIYGLNGTTYISIGNSTISGDYNVGDAITPTLESCFSAAFASARLANGGVVLIKAGSYTLSNTVNIPPGITILGESAGVIIDGQMYETPMFYINAAAAPVSVGYEQVSNINTKFGIRETRVCNIILIDNVNNTTGFSMNTVPMIRCSQGAVFSAEDVSFIGRINSLTPDATYRAIGHAVTLGTIYGTSLNVKNCYIDGVTSGIEFLGTDGSNDFLNISNTKIMYFGGDGSSTNSDRSAISTTVCNATINDNYFYGKNDLTFNARYGILIKNISVTNSNVARMSFVGNAGGLSDQTINESINKFVKVDYTGNIFGLLDNENSWGTTNGNTWSITVGDGVNSVGDITGPYALEYAISRSSSTIGGNIYVNYGVYTIMVGGTSVIKQSIIGVLGNSTNGLPIVQLDLTNPSCTTDIIGRSTLFLGPLVKNIKFNKTTSAITARSVTVGGLTATDSNREIKIENCSFINTGLIYASTSTEFQSSFRLGIEIENCVFYQDTGISNTLSCYIRDIPDNITIINSSFLGYGYALGIGDDGITSYTANTNCQVLINGCYFDEWNPSTGTSRIVSSINNLPTTRDRYIWIITSNKVSIKDTNIFGTNVSDNKFAPFSSSLLTPTGTTEYIYISSKNLLIDNCIIDGPNQTYSYVYGSTIYVHLPTMVVRQTDSLIIKNSKFRGNQPLLIGGDENGFTTPGAFIDISSSNFYNYAGYSVKSSNTLGISVASNYPITYGDGSVLSSIRIRGCTFNASNQFNSSNIYLSGVSVTEANVGAVLIKASGWNLVFDGNVIYSAGATNNTYNSAALSIEIYKNSTETYNSSTITNNLIEFYSNGNSSLSYNANISISGGYFNISNNTFIYSGVSPLSLQSGFMLIDSKTRDLKCNLICNNIFRAEDDPNGYAIYFYGNASTSGGGIFKNNTIGDEHFGFSGTITKLINYENIPGKWVIEWERVHESININGTF
jgi:hypothetical protein